MNIGQTILNQIKSLSTQDLMCWGATKFQTFSEGQIVTKNNCGGLVFKVSGMLHKGHVVISLTGADLYEVRIGKLTKTGFVQKGETMTEVFCDQLNETIDNMVEGYYAKGKEIYSNVNLFENV